MIFVLVLAPVRVFRDGLARALAARPAISVVGTAAEPAEALTRVRDLGPDVVLVDTSSQDGIAAGRALGEGGCKAKLVALAAPEEDNDVVSCAEAGFQAFVAREGSFDDIVDAIEGVVRGESVCSPRIAATLLRRIAATARSGPPDPAPSDKLTLRERQIVTLIDDGLSNKEIAARLQIEVSTVKNHVHRILEKLSVSRRGEAAARVRMVVHSAHPSAQPVGN